MKRKFNDYNLIVKKIINEKFADEKIYNLTKWEIRELLLELVEEIRDSNFNPGELQSSERMELINANVKIMDKYKEIFSDIQIMLDYLNGNMEKKNVFYSLFKKYDGKKLFMEDYYD